MTVHDFPARLVAEEFCLRPMSEGDLPEAVRQLSDERVAPWLAAVAQPFGPTEAQALLEHSQHPGEHLRIIEIQGAAAGCICLGAGLWYWLDPAFQGRGVMSAALHLALAEWFSRPAPPLLAACRTDNAASLSLLARLGFARCPGSRRMFFQTSGRSHPCHDFLMAPEQWHLLNPPRYDLDGLSLRPARQKDVPMLALMLPGATPPWPTAEALPGFVERHRFRGAASGLFVIEDKLDRSIGMALMVAGDPPALAFLSSDEANAHADLVEQALAKGLPAPAR
ncbi:GNAT family N-acetyltransferase [Mameliella alba]|uniref:GNAT family N-acetyltransferase n=1 Tax=Mameliella alba TaxID=561184 RepID=UPI001C938A3C|nr:GNAT family N-acetyltransferase [Mameliella alba]MBY6122377.1 GNAT family N-acetyltransferase [Mameliella alba]